MKELDYVPELLTIESIILETRDTCTFRTVFEKGKRLSYLPGQFAEISVLGVGECPISFSSTPTRAEALEFCIRGVGTVTKAIHQLDAGDRLGIRGPYGNSFPLELLKGKHILFVAGGIGLAPLRSLINYCLDRRKDYRRIEILYGARSPDDLCFRREFPAWGGFRDTALTLTVDKEARGWKGRVGFVPAVLKEMRPSPADTIAVTCGPPIMIKLVLKELESLGFADDQVVTTLEMKMKCGVGHCGRCNIGESYVCKDGPVYLLSRLKQLPWEF
jgi:NAD(P)H-flavin reductase